MMRYMPSEPGGHDSFHSLALSDSSRILALDWGSKRVGLAISDPLGFTAQGLPTMSRKSKQRDINYLRSLVRKHHVSLVLLGNPLQMDGTEGSHTEMIRSVGEELQEELGVKVRLWDERLTSAEANRIFEEAGVSASKRRASVDRVAAVLLLQNFLESQSQKPRAPESAS
jgi:putative Holliday junction resolvase